MKKEELNYFEEFKKNVDIALELSIILNEYIDTFDSSKSREIELRVHKLENDADRNLHRILNYLIKDFLPPIEREDIVTLVHKIDDVVDNIDEIVINLNILNISKLRDDMKSFTNLLHTICVSLQKLMDKFKTSKKYEEIQELVVNINGIEEAGDKLFENAIKNLYMSEENPIEILKWHNIYNGLEKCFDSCENVASCVDEILLKNS